MSAETRNSLTRRHIHWYVTAQCVPCQRSNAYSCNNRRAVGTGVYFAVLPGGCVTVQYSSCKKRCFLLGPSRGYIKRTNVSWCQIVIERRIRQVELLQSVRVTEKKEERRDFSPHQDGRRPNIGIPEILGTKVVSLKS
jgi:hypothetical protein